MRHLLLLLLPLALAAQESRVRTGAEILLERHLDLIRGERVGILCNQTAVLPNRTHLVDTLRSLGIEVAALFSPEHGILGTRPAGARVADSTKAGVPVHSLYQAPAPRISELLRDIDVLLVDIQDVGARFYTYYITLSHALEAASELRIRCIVLDRPNPINGVQIEGPILDSALQSGIGRFPLPIRHGLTLGETARMMVGEGWIRGGVSLDVIPLQGWNRRMFFDETHLPWTPPSPNMRFLSTAVVYPGTCLFEATNVSEGRGTFRPFEYVGAPWIDGKDLAADLNMRGLQGVTFHPVRFTPRADSVRSPDPKYRDESCGGVFLEVRDRRGFRPVLTALTILSALRERYPGRLTIDHRGFDQRAGTSDARRAVESGKDLSKGWKLAEFEELRRKYLIY